jgi:hypothetical protein
MDKFNMHMAETQAFFKDLRENFVHIEGSEPVDLTLLMARLDTNYAEIQRLIMVMGKPKVEVKDEKKEAGKDNQAPKNPEGNK